MNITCDKCGKKYVIADDKLAGKASAKIRCKQCQNLITVQVAATADGGAAVRAPAPAPAPAAFAAPNPGLGGWEEESTRAMPALDMSATWYAMIQGVQEGPFDLGKLKQKVDAGEITLRTYLWKPSMGDWKRASDVPEVSMVFAGVAVAAAQKPAPAPAPVPSPDAAVTAERAAAQPAKANGSIEIEPEAEAAPNATAQKIEQEPLNDLFNGMTQDLAPVNDEPASDAAATVPPAASASSSAKSEPVADPFAALSQGDNVQPAPPGEATKFFIAQAGVNKRNPPWKIALAIFAPIGGIAALLYLLSSLKVIPAVTRVTEDGREVQESFFSPAGASAIFDSLSGEGKKRRALEAERRKAEAAAAAKAAALAAANTGSGTPKIDKRPDVPDVPVKPKDTGAAKLYEDILSEPTPIGGRIPKDRQAGENARQVDKSGLDAEAAMKVVQQNMKALEGCIETALHRNPNLAVGSIFLKITVGSSGAVKSTTIDPKKHANSDWADCMANAAKRMAFPKSDGESEIEVPLKVGVSL